MKYVYLDNYRGFQDSVIPVLDVNFCVGENSSGKTSFLSAISLFASNRFWFEQSFDGPESSYKHFKDYVSVAADNQTYFRMGFAEEVNESTSKNGDENKRVTGYLLTYIEKEGAPRVASCTTNLGTTEITIFFDESQIKYKVSKRKNKVTMSDFGDGLFNEWAKEQENRTGGDIKTAPAHISREHMPPIFALFMLSQEVADKRSRHQAHFPEPPFGGDAAWIAPIRSKPRRTYDEVNPAFSPDGTHIPYLIKKILSDEKIAERFSLFINKIGIDSGLFKQVNVHKFGESTASPFELEVVLENKPLNMSNVGYGVSQALPIIVEAFSRSHGALFAIQQPEVHLHPRAQASMGEMMFVLATTENKKFVVETHSDFTIDRFRTLQRESDSKVDSQVLFFERIEGKNTVHTISIESNGDLSEDQPDKYRDFFLKESLRVIGV
ncbi:AAA family ATPase [Stenotrophomonas humi]